jgi:hypothetical protein
VRLAKAIVPAVMFVAGCGGGDGDGGGDSAAAAVGTARAALLDGDGDRACEQFAPEARRSLAAVLAAWTGGSRLAACEDVARSVGRLVSPLDRRRIEEMALQVQNQTPDSATVRVVGEASVPGAGLAVRVERRDGRWLIVGWE